MGFRRRGYDWAPAVAHISRPSRRRGASHPQAGPGAGHAPSESGRRCGHLCPPEADFILGSVHNLSPERGGTDLFFLDFSTVQACYDALDDYFASLALLAATDFYDVLAHLIYPLRYMQAPVT